MKRTYPYLILVIAMLLLHGCKKDPATAEQTQAGQVAANVEVETAKVLRGPVRQLIEVTGTLTALPNHDVKVSSLVPGRVIRLFVVEGDTVSAGKQIAQLDGSTFLEQVREAKANLENARLNEERTQKLYERGIAAAKEKEDAHKEYLVALSAYNTASLQLSRCKINSPLSGQVIKRFVNVGEDVDGTASQPIMEVANFDEVELSANLQPTFLASVKAEEPVEVKTDAFRDVVFPGTVLAVLAAVDVATNSATVRIRIPNSNHQLRGGMFATADIVATVRNESLYVPASAIVTSEAGPRIFVVGPDSKVQERPVQTGYRDGAKVEILSGAREGEVVVTTGNYGLEDQMRVTVVKQG
jgi:membrane fusion protein, multidrug efflux system